MTLNSLSHAFAEQTEAWCQRVFRASCARMVEMGLFRLAAAYFSPSRLERTLVIAPEARQIIREYEAGGRRHGHPVVIMLPHMTMSEAATLLPSRAAGLEPVHVIFRPLNQPAISRWVTREREIILAGVLAGSALGVAAIR